MKITFICYSDENYFTYQKRLVDNISTMGFSDIVAFNRNDLIKTEFYKENQNILDKKRGGGYWLWKPFFILETLKKQNDGDIIFYMDCGDLCSKNILDLIQVKIQSNDGFFVIRSNNINKQWTKRDCFVLMDCDNERYHNGTQLEAGCCGFMKNKFTIEFLQEWLKFALNENILTDVKNICGKENFPEFIDHRHDQSILSLLTIKYNIKSIYSDDISSYIGYNVL
jgi:hypothetical protein